MRVVFALLLLGVALEADAKTLYVNNSGTCSDSTTYANNDAANPWCTIGRAAWGNASRSSPNAAQAAAAGDLVLITEGVYEEEAGNQAGSAAKYDIALHPVNDGTAGNPITFRGVGTVQLRIVSGRRGPEIGCNARTYIIWDHFYIDDSYSSSVADSGPIVFTGLNLHCELINSTVVGHNVTYTPGVGGTYFGGNATFDGNYQVVRIDEASYVTIKNNTLSRVRKKDGTDGSQNEACLMTYSAQYITIEHNEAYDCGEGLFLKGYHTNPQGDMTVRYNYVHDNHFGGIRSIYMTTGTSLWYQNVVKNNTFYGFNIDELADGIEIFNNTIIGNGSAGMLFKDPSTAAVFKNNIVQGNHTGLGSSTASDPTVQTITADRNLYYGNTNFARWNIDLGTLNISYATWQGTYGEDANGSTSDPLFVSTGSGPTYYKLQGGSPALTLGRVINSVGGTNGDTIPAGAYITGNEDIGVEGSSVVRLFAPLLHLRR